MAESKEPPKSGFLRKVVRFALNPTTDWADLNGNESETKEIDQAKTELKAMIERKRRNDFVRKREFDMLRKIRREGLTGEGLAGLEGLSHLDDSEVRTHDSGARADADVKDKIDAIERMMVGESGASRRGAAVMRSTTPSMSDSFFSATTAPQVMASAPQMADAFKPTTPMQMDSVLSPPPAGPNAPSSVMSKGVSALSPLHMSFGENSNAFAVEVTELAHDPDLDEAVIAFANADFEQCERTLHHLIGPGGGRAHHTETWFALFDLYRATGLQAKFDALAMDYVQRFGWSPPQWFSLPRLVAEAAAGERPRQATRSTQLDGTIGWVAPDVVESDAIAQLRAQLLHMPLPWVLDWRHVRRIDAQACVALTRLLGDWANEPIEMRWIGGEKFFSLLADLAPAGVRDADPSYWLLRLEALRLANRAPDFDQAAIDYCLTYEVSPPSWAAARCPLLAAGVGRQRRDDRTAHSSGRTVGVVPGVRAGRGQRADDRDPRAQRPAGRRHRPAAQEPRRPDRPVRRDPGFMRAPDPHRLPRRGRSAQLGAGAADREPHRQLRRCAPAGCAVLRRDGHHRTCPRDRPQHLIPPRDAGSEGSWRPRYARFPQLT